MCRALVLALVALALTSAAASAHPSAYPRAKQLAAARHYVAYRHCVCSFAVIDSAGRLRGFAPHRVYVTASVVKAMLLVSYLRKIGKRAPNAAERGALGPRANTVNARGRVLRNRLTLKRAMERHGFTNYRREWWHFEHRVRGKRYLDLTLGC
ncbi:MAG TPA: M15 family metallopeptidase [Thermoleophilaceae bacterium]